MRNMSNGGEPSSRLSKHFSWKNRQRQTDNTGWQPEATLALAESPAPVFLNTSSWKNRQRQTDTGWQSETILALAESPAPVFLNASSGKNIAESKQANVPNKPC